MKRRLIILATAAMLLMPAVSNAQFGKFLDKAVKKVNGAMDSTVFKEDKKPLKDNPPKDLPENAPKDQEAPKEFNFDKLMGGKVDLKYEEAYSFTAKLYMVTTVLEKKEEMQMDLNLYFGPKTPAIGMDASTTVENNGKKMPVTTTMVMDANNKCMVFLMNSNGSKMNMISALPDPSKLESENNKPSKQPKPGNFVKTGNTKMIAGYLCDEYTYSEDNNKTTGKVWLTKDAALKIDKRIWQKTGMGAYYGYEGFEGGVLLASETFDAKGNLVARAETKEINLNYSHSINLKGLKFTQMDLNQAQPYQR